MLSLRFSAIFRKELIVNWACRHKERGVDRNPFYVLLIWFEIPPNFLDLCFNCLMMMGVRVCHVPMGSLRCVGLVVLQVWVCLMMGSIFVALCSLILN